MGKEDKPLLLGFGLFSGAAPLKIIILNLKNHPNWKETSSKPKPGLSSSVLIFQGVFHLPWELSSLGNILTETTEQLKAPENWWLEDESSLFGAMWYVLKD